MTSTTSTFTSSPSRWCASLLATALVVALFLGGGTDSAEAIDPADVDTVFIADGTNFADALVGATIATLNTSPLLGVAPTTIPSETADELDRLTSDRTDLLDTIVILGGPAAVSDAVAGQLGAWATSVERIAGSSRWGTYAAISELLPAKIGNADLLDGLDSTAFLGADGIAVDSDLLDGLDSTAFLGADGKAVDSDLLDGLDSTEFALATEVPALEMHAARGTSFFQPPDPLPPASFDHDELDVEFTTTTAGRLHITYQAVFDHDCSDTGVEFAWLVLDGTPIPSSATRLPADSVGAIHHTLTVVTDDVVPAGTHTVEVNAGADPCGGSGSATSFYATGTVLVLAD